MKPFDIKIKSENDLLIYTQLIENIEITKNDLELPYSIQNIEHAFIEMSNLSNDMMTKPCHELPKNIKSRIIKLRKYIKAEVKYVKQTLKQKRKLNERNNY